MPIPFAAIEFTTGRIIFATFFVIAFATLMFFSYKKDAKNNQKHYQNSAIYVAIGILVVIGLLFLSKYLIRG